MGRVGMVGSAVYCCSFGGVGCGIDGGGEGGGDGGLVELWA